MGVLSLYEATIAMSRRGEGNRLWGRAPWRRKSVCGAVPIAILILLLPLSCQGHGIPSSFLTDDRALPTLTTRRRKEENSAAFPPLLFLVVRALPPLAQLAVS